MSVFHGEQLFAPSEKEKQKRGLSPHLAQGMCISNVPSSHWEPTVSRKLKAQLTLSPSSSDLQRESGKDAQLDPVEFCAPSTSLLCKTANVALGLSCRPQK